MKLQFVNALSALSGTEYNALLIKDYEPIGAAIKAGSRVRCCLAAGLGDDLQSERLELAAVHAFPDTAMNAFSGLAAICDGVAASTNAPCQLVAYSN